MENLVEPLVAALLSILTGVASAIGLAFRQWLKAKATPFSVGLSYDLARIVVNAAERLGADTELSAEGKYVYAEQALKDLAANFGVHLSSDQANALIHSALGDMDRADNPYPVLIPLTDDEDEGDDEVA